MHKAGVLAPDLQAITRFPSNTGAGEMPRWGGRLFVLFSYRSWPHFTVPGGASKQCTMGRAFAHQHVSQAPIHRDCRAWPIRVADSRNNRKSMSSPPESLPSATIQQWITLFRTVGNGSSYPICNIDPPFATVGTACIGGDRYAPFYCERGEANFSTIRFLSKHPSR